MAIGEVSEILGCRWIHIHTRSNSVTTRHVHQVRKCYLDETKEFGLENPEEQMIAYDSVPRSTVDQSQESRIVYPPTSRIPIAIKVPQNINANSVIQRPKRDIVKPTRYR